MKRILLPTDFSPHAGKALEYAINIARKTGASLKLLHVTEDAESVLLDNVIPADEIQEGIDATAAVKLKMLRESVVSTESIEVYTEIVHGSITNSILKVAQEWQSDLIIVGTLGISGLRDVFLGSKTASLIGQSPIPIIAIPLEYEGGAPSKILLAIHDAKEAGDQLTTFYELAQVFHASITLTSFTDASYVAPTEYHEEIIELKKAEAIVKARTPYLEVNTKQLVGRKFIENVNQFVAENGYNLVAMTTHERSLLGSIISPSLTKKMSYKTKVPLLAMPLRS
jgi:nucleotide-binding universal stress UspA family protein